MVLLLSIIILFYLFFYLIFCDFYYIFTCSVSLKPLISHRFGFNHHTTYSETVRHFLFYLLLVVVFFYLQS